MSSVKFVGVAVHRDWDSDHESRLGITTRLTDGRSAIRSLNAGSIAPPHWMECQSISCTKRIAHNLHTTILIYLSIWIPRLGSLGYGMILKSSWKAGRNFHSTEQRHVVAPTRCGVDSEAKEKSPMISNESTDSSLIISTANTGTTKYWYNQLQKKQPENWIDSWKTTESNNQKTKCNDS